MKIKKFPIKDRKKLRDKAWDVFSIWIRKRDKGTCVTCNARHWDEELGEFTIKGMQAGHFWHNVLDFDEENINCQCQRCNHFLSGNLAPYSVYLLQKLGKKGFDALEKRKNLAIRGEIRSAEDYEAIINEYSQRLDRGA